MVLFLSLWLRLTGKRRLKTGVASEKTADLNTLCRLYEKGMIKPVIDRIYALANVADAHRYVEAGRKAGNVIINVAGDE